MFADIEDMPLKENITPKQAKSDSSGSPVSFAELDEVAQAQ